MSGPLPLLGLRAFVEVGRCGSIKGAAEHLGVTSGAVSQQVKALELRLGTTLFERLNREMRLTSVGRNLLADLADAFERIEDAVEKHDQRRARHGATLTVSTTGVFAASWLVPRLGRFRALYPEIEVRVLSTPGLVPLGGGSGSADVAIRHGLGRWGELEAEPLLRPRLVPVGSPSLLASGPPIKQPLDCLLYPLLHDSLGADWRLWLQAMGATHRDRRLALGMRFSDSTLLTRAAVAGQGLALLRDAYVADEVSAGRLEVALDAPLPAEFAYYVVTRPGARSRQNHIGRFVDWIVGEARG